MDPRSVSQEQLARWAVDKGYLLPSGSIPASLSYAAATSTPSRRRLWEAIINTVKDRRYVRKVRQELASKLNRHRSGDEDRVESTRLRVLEVEDDMTRTLKRINDKINKVTNIEEATHQLEIKEVLFSRVRSKHLCQMKESCQTRDSMKELVALPVGQKTVATEAWVEGAKEELRSMWYDPALPRQVSTRVLDDNMDLNGLWHALIGQNNKLMLTCRNAQHKAETGYRDLSNSALPPVVDWPVYLAEQCVDGIITDALIVLLQGLGLSKRGAVQDALQDDVVNSVRLHLQHVTSHDRTSSDVLMDDELWEKTRKKAEVSQTTYEALRVEVDVLRRLYKEAYVTALTARSELAMTVRGLTTRVRSNAPMWRATLERHRSLVQQHSHFMWHHALSEIRLEPGIDFNSQSLPGHPKENVLCRLQFYNEERNEDIEYLRVLLKGSEASEDLEKESRRGRRLRKTLNAGRERAHNLVQGSGQIHRILQFFSKQPFGSMIPESFTVSGLTWKEWRLQLSVFALPSLPSESVRHDSTFYPFEL